MAADYADSMRSIGLPALTPDACPAAFESAGYSSNMVRTGMDFARFAAVNQAKSEWSYVANLLTVPEVISLHFFFLDVPSS